MTKYWFKPKTYGYGLTPISWEGWVVTLIFVGILVLAAYANQMFLYPRPEEVAGFVLDVTVFTTLFTLLCKGKMNGKLGWRWGKKKWF